ncbi:MAG: TonB-dependent receptor [Flavobacteriales bacterium]|nr:TonB-dependent receptor [Flavobacteriales bacterium]
MLFNKKSFLVLVLIVLNYSVVYGQIQNEKTENAHISGNCEMCKNRIEKAIFKENTSSGIWNVDTKIATIKYDSIQTSLDTILKKVAEAGHDNQKYQANKTTYEDLPMCCQYRVPEKDSIHKNPFKYDSFSSDSTKVLETVSVRKKLEATKINSKDAQLTYTLSKRELQKAACCNLAESFDTNSSIDVSYADAVTGSKQIKMLGLDQKYIQINLDGFPEVRGINTTQGINYIPGRFINSIDISKGSTSVINGYESITGIISVNPLDYKNKNETNLNVYYNNNSRAEANFTSVQKIDSLWSNAFMSHASGRFQKQDRNNDSFIDNPLSKQLNIMNIIKYDGTSKNGIFSKTGFQATIDEKEGGQKQYFSIPRNNAFYGLTQNNKHFQIWNKTAYNFKNKPYKSIGFMNKYYSTNTDNLYGNRAYTGKENYFLSQIVFQNIFKNTNHSYKIGSSFMFNDFKENFENTEYNRTENNYSLFGEYEFLNDKFNAIIGSRVDFHNLAGTQFLPKVMLKYKLFRETTLRASFGKGFRTANVLAENQKYFISNRKLTIKNNNGKIYGLKPEIATNYGTSITHCLEIFGKETSFNFDFYRTEFKNQIIPDLDYSSQEIVITNQDKKTFANSFQAEWIAKWFRGFEMRLAYKYYDVKATYNGKLQQAPFQPKHRSFLNLSYQTNKIEQQRNWNFDFTLQYFSKQRIPDTSKNPIPFQRKAFSDSYFLANAQISRNFSKKIRAYLGFENIGGYTQSYPIIDAKNPFGNYFDSSLVYAPIQGTNVYAGIDLSL